jgi:hypothetical protein
MRFHPVADGADYVEAVEVHLTLDGSRAFLLNYQGFLDGCLALQLPLFKEVLDMARNLRTVNRMACSVAVLNEQDLVVASARGNLEPLLALATQRLQGHDLSLGDVTRRVPKTELDRCQ